MAEEKALVVARSNKILLYKFEAQGLAEHTSYEFSGTVVNLQRVAYEKHIGGKTLRLDAVFVLTKNLDCSLLGTNQYGLFEEFSSGNIKDLQGKARSPPFHVVADVKSRFIAIHAYANSVKVLPLKKGKDKICLQNAFNCRIDQN